MPKKSYEKLNLTLIQNLKKKVDELRESEEKFKSIFEKSADGILIADAETKKFIEVNEQLCKYTGYLKKEILKKSVLDIHPKKDLPYVLNEFRLQSQGKKNTCRRYPCLKKRWKNSLRRC